MIPADRVFVNSYSKVEHKAEGQFCVEINTGPSELLPRKLNIIEAST